MKKVFGVLGILVWVGGAIAAIVLGVGAKSFLLALLYLVIAFVAGALYYAIYKILDNQDIIMESIYANTREIENKFEGLSNNSKSEAKEDTVIPEKSNFNEYIECPNCGTKQQKNREKCYKCGASLS